VTDRNLPWQTPNIVSVQERLALMARFRGLKRGVKGKKYAFSWTRFRTAAPALGLAIGRG
jgi:hypothetical protein